MRISEALDRLRDSGCPSETALKLVVYALQARSRRGWDHFQPEPEEAVTKAASTAFARAGIVPDVIGFPPWYRPLLARTP